jgi:hypothetical protein
MSTLTIKKSDAITAFMKADDAGKLLLKNLFPDENLSGKITDMVKTVEDALALDKGWTAEDENWLMAVKTSSILTRVLNEGWEPDYNDNSEPKWYVWMHYDRSSCAFRFLISNFGYTFANAAAGSRHVFKTEELAKYFAKQFSELIKQVILSDKTKNNVTN